MDVAFVGVCLTLLGYIFSSIALLGEKFKETSIICVLLIAAFLAYGFIDGLRP